MNKRQISMLWQTHRLTVSLRKTNVPAWALHTRDQRTLQDNVAKRCPKQYKNAWQWTQWTSSEPKILSAMCLKQKRKIHSATYLSKSPNAIKMHENHNTCPVCLYVHVLAVPQHFSKKHMQVMAFNEDFLTWKLPRTPDNLSLSSKLPLHNSRTGLFY